MKKRILILAGGVASRMKKEADNLNVDQQLIEQADTLTKGMISVGKAGKSLMDYQLFNAHLAGFEEILLLLHPDDAFTQEYYEEQMSTGSTWGLNIQFSRQYVNSLSGLFHILVIVRLVILKPSRLFKTLKV